MEKKKKKKQEEEEVAVLRKKMIHRANPVPYYEETSNGEVPQTRYKP